jgi:hypothetical protein
MSTRRSRPIDVEHPSHYEGRVPLVYRPEPYIPPPVSTDDPDETKKPRRTKKLAAQYLKRELSISGAEGPIPLYYGLHEIEGELLYTFQPPGNLSEFWAVIGFGWGEFHALDSVKANDKASGDLPAGSLTWWFYPGVASQGVDPNLAAVDASWNETLANVGGDASRNIAYVVVRLRGVGKVWPEFPRLVFRCRTRKILDPRTSTIAYSENWALQVYDFQRHPEGRARLSSKLNTASFIAGADVSDELVGSDKRFTSHFALVDASSPDEWEKNMLLVGNAWLPFTANQFHLVMDRPVGAVAASLTDADFSVDVPTDAWRTDPEERVNEVIVEYLDTTTWELTQLPPKTLAGVTADTKVPATYRLPWIHDRSQADRLATFLLNDAQRDLRLRLEGLASTSSRKIGDVVAVSLSQEGVAAQWFRIVRRERLTHENTNLLELIEYSADRYANSVVSGSSKIASTYPDPGAAPPEVTGHAITEELYQLQSGVWTNRGRLVFTIPNYLWFVCVEVWLAIDGGEARLIGTPTASPFFVESLQDLKACQVTLRVRGQFGVSPGVTLSFTPAGKTNPPGDVPWVGAGASDGDVTLFWQPAADLDLVGYRVRRGLSTDTWATMQPINMDVRSNALLDRPPAGTFKYGVKAFDSGGRESSNATFVTINTTTGQPAAASSDLGVGFSGAFTRYCDQVTGSGNLIIFGDDDTLYGGVARNRKRLTALLCRGGTFASFDAEISAGSYLSIAAWESALDAPRRRSAPIWAPLPANASGEVYGIPDPSVGFPRQSESRLAILGCVDSGVEVNQRIARVEALIVDAVSGEKTYSGVRHQGAAAATHQIGVRLSSSSPFGQVIVAAPPSAVDGLYYGRFLRLTSQQVPFEVQSGDGVTNGSGVALIDVSYPGTSADMEELDVKVAAAAASAGKAVIVDSYNTGTALQFRVKSYNLTDGSVAANVYFQYRVTDFGARVVTAAP